MKSVPAVSLSKIVINAVGTLIIRTKLPIVNDRLASITTKLAEPSESCTCIVEPKPTPALKYAPKAWSASVKGWSFKLKLGSSQRIRVIDQSTPMSKSPSVREPEAVPLSGWRYIKPSTPPDSIRAANIVSWFVGTEKSDKVIPATGASISVLETDIDKVPRLSVELVSIARLVYFCRLYCYR